ncbi:MAG: ATP-binding protein, partial [Anaerolineae bacterium]|nr:ATP-binding protein [Anaerolineae bacterium]
MTLLNNVSGIKLHPEFEKLLSGLPYSQISLLSHFTEGRSGAPVLLIDVNSAPDELHDHTSGLHVAKIVQVRKNSNELEAHNSAAGYFRFIPQIVASHQERLTFEDGETTSKGTYLVIVYSIAQGSLRDSCTLLMLLRKQAGRVAEYINDLSETIHSEWQEYTSVMSLIPFNLLRENMLRTLVRGNRSVANIAEQTINVDRYRPFIAVADSKLLLPNPVAYLENEEYWHGARGISFPNGPIHGDLHSENIICLQNFVSSMRIDFAGFDPEVCVFYDLLYLELNILLHIFTHDPEGWHDYVRYLATDWELQSEIISGSIAAIHAHALLKTLRQPIYAISRKYNREEDFEIAFQLGITAIGLNYMRKLQPDTQSQINALLYAAYGLRRALTLLSVRSPIVDEDMVAYPKQGAVSEDDVGISVGFTEYPWKDDLSLFSGHTPSSPIDAPLSGERQATSSTDVSSPGDGEPLIVDMSQIERRALERIERSIVARRGRDISDEVIAEFAECITRIRKHLWAKGQSSGITRDEEIDSRRDSQLMQKLCLQYFDKPYSMFIEDALSPVKQEETDVIEEAFSAEPTPQKLTRQTFAQLVKQLNDERDEWLEKHQNELQGALQGKTNAWILRELSRIDQRLENIRKETPPAWFDVHRYIDKPPVLLTEQPVVVTISIQNLGRQSRKITYTEQSSDSIVIVDTEKDNSPRSTSLRFVATIPPGEYAEFTYTFFVKSKGKHSFFGSLKYAGQEADWDDIPVQSITCQGDAQPSVLNANRFFRYLPDKTEFILRITNPPLTRIAQKIELKEFGDIGEKSIVESFSLDRYLLPGESVSLSYSVDGHQRFEDCKFSSKSNLTYQEIDEPTIFTLPTGTSCKPLEYETLRQKDVIAARDTHIRELIEIIQAVSLGESDGQHIIHIYGSRGHGKTTMLHELIRQAKHRSYDCIYIQVQRSINLVARIIVELLQTNIFDEKDIQQSIARLDIKNEYEEKLLHYIVHETMKLNLTFDEADIIVRQAVFEVLKQSAQQQPLLIAVDDSHEFQATRELELMRYVISRFAETTVPIIFAFAETTEYAVGSATGVVESSVSTYLLKDRKRQTIYCDELDEAECYGLIDRLIPYPQFDNQLKRFVYKLSAGVPQDIYDILRWLTTSPEMLELHGNLWSMTQWLMREEAKFEDISRILPDFARGYFGDNSDTFKYLQILSVVGERIPAELAKDLHTEYFPDDTSDEEYERKIAQLVQIDFIIKEANHDLRFTHLSRRNTIYEDDNFAASPLRIEVRES